MVELMILAGQDGQSRTIRQFQFTDWPRPQHAQHSVQRVQRGSVSGGTTGDATVPSSGETFIEFIGQVHKTKEQFGHEGPITVHCRCGISSPVHNHGRTGPPGTCEVGRLVRRPGGPPHQTLKQVKRLTPLTFDGRSEWSQGQSHKRRIGKETVEWGGAQRPLARQERFYLDIFVGVPQSS